MQAIPANEIPNPLTWEAVLHAKHGLSVVLALNQRIFVKNTSDKTQVLASGTVLAGWFKGRFWHLQRSDSGESANKKRKQSNDEPTEVSEADVLYQLQDADSTVSFKGKESTVMALVAARRAASQGEAIQYHSKHDKPQAGKPGWFTLELESYIYFRAEDVPTKGEVKEGEAPKIPMHHLAGCLPASAWETCASHVVWAVKWSEVEKKGLTPVRPMVMTSRAVTIPPNSAMELLKAAPAAESAAMAEP